MEDVCSGVDLFVGVVQVQTLKLQSTTLYFLEDSDKPTSDGSQAADNAWGTSQDGLQYVKLRACTLCRIQTHQYLMVWAFKEGRSRSKAVRSCRQALLMTSLLCSLPLGAQVAS